MLFGYLSNVYSFIVILFLLHREACGILVPQPGIAPAPPALEAQTLNQWTAREVPHCIFYDFDYFFYIFNYAKHIFYSLH